MTTRYGLLPRHNGQVFSVSASPQPLLLSRRSPAFTCGGGPSPEQPHPRWRRALHRGRPSLLTVAIESSCDDTCVAVLEKTGPAARLLFNARVTSDNRAYGGVHPTVAVESHTAHLSGLVLRALQVLPALSPPVPDGIDGDDNSSSGGGGGSSSSSSSSSSSAGLPVRDAHTGEWTLRRRPDFVSVTRGPGMVSNLATGLNTAKGLAVGWGVPLLGVHHMQAHALTPRLVAALARPLPDGESRNDDTSSPSPTPAFPFLTLLVSGGHTLLVLSRSLTSHAVLASANNIAIGDMLDKCARDILSPADVSAAAAAAAAAEGAGGVGGGGGESPIAYGAALEAFAFPRSSSSGSEEESFDHASWYVPPARRADEIAVFDSGRGWTLTPPLSESRAMAYDFAALNGSVRRVVVAAARRRRQEEKDGEEVVAEAAEQGEGGGSGGSGGMDTAERRELARACMKLAFEHLASRVVFALTDMDRQRRKSASQKSSSSSSPPPPPVRTLVVSGGVASNRFLMHVLRTVLDARGFAGVAIVAPPPALCTDNAAMIAWAGAEMWEAGWRTELDVLARRKWSMDPDSEDGGILGVGGWVRRDGMAGG